MAPSRKLLLQNRTPLSPSKVQRLSALFVVLLISAAAASAKEKAAPALPYLGPGTGQLSAADYERIYKNYIQTSILLGYTFSQEAGPACDQALAAIFRQAGMFGYPVPAEAQQVQKSSRKISGYQVENYEMGGLILQLVRQAATKAPVRLMILNSSSPKAVRRLSQIAKQELLELKRDPVTGLERVQKIPVGYPHPLLTPEGQGLFVKELRFARKGDRCEPEEFHDNSWVGGFDLSRERCEALQADAVKVWGGQTAPSDFARSELGRMKNAAVKAAIARGTKESEARALVERHFVHPLTSEINVVGAAMRNLAQCNLLALGRSGRAPQEAPAGGAEKESPAEGPAGSTVK